MTALGATIQRSRWRLEPWLEIGLILMALAAVSIARLGATQAGLDALTTGLAFGLGLLAVGAAGGMRPRLDLRRLAPALIVGVALAMVLITIAQVGAALAGASTIRGLGRQAAPLVPWAAITVVVAVAEEALLRGLLFDRVRRTAGIGIAIAVTTVAFALMHVPLYGWHVVPLDLAVGLALGGLRVVSGGIAAPAVAHAVADLATWWL